MDYIQEICYRFTTNQEECRTSLVALNPNIEDILNS